MFYICSIHLAIASRSLPSDLSVSSSSLSLSRPSEETFVSLPSRHHSHTHPPVARVRSFVGQQHHHLRRRRRRPCGQKANTHTGALTLGKLKLRFKEIHTYVTKHKKGGNGETRGETYPRVRPRA